MFFIHFIHVHTLVYLSYLFHLFVASILFFILLLSLEKNLQLWNALWIHIYLCRIFFILFFLFLGYKISTSYYLSYFLLDCVWKMETAEKWNVWWQYYCFRMKPSHSCKVATAIYQPTNHLPVSWIFHSSAAHYDYVQPTVSCGKRIHWLGL